ncbi:MAG: hypothetical protein A2201_04985 [Alicyclobacillus sp. RIFOXYA1_FULL_53_8]|nr:MAG: hypothetical protein A2201_04985 [Alicyclobacillus sp. RIFOXYA1_FULL_53_8]
MSAAGLEGVVQLSTHVIQIPLPTSTLPPENETNTYLIHSQGECLLVDVGTDHPTTLSQLVNYVDARGNSRIVGLVATHYHHDHTAGLLILARSLQVPVYVHELDLALALREMKRLSLPLGAEQFIVSAPARLTVGELEITLEHHPGHTHGHLHVLIPEDEVVLVGDHLSGFGTVWIGPPDGHMGSYYKALDALVHQHYAIAGPGHGAAIHDVAAAAQALKHRRSQREDQMLAYLRENHYSAAQLVALIYGNSIPPDAIWVAEKTVLAHLQHLLVRHKIRRSYDASTRTFYYEPTSS